SAAPTDDRDIICDRLDGLSRVPDRAFDPSWQSRRLDGTAEVDVVDHFRPRKLPWIAEGQPFFRVLLLPTVPDDFGGTVRDRSECRSHRQEFRGSPCSP